MQKFNTSRKRTNLVRPRAPLTNDPSKKSNQQYASTTTQQMPFVQHSKFIGYGQQMQFAQPTIYGQIPQPAVYSHQIPNAQHEQYPQPINYRQPNAQLPVANTV